MQARQGRPAAHSSGVAPRRPMVIKRRRELRRLGQFSCPRCHAIHPLAQWCKGCGACLQCCICKAAGAVAPSAP